MKTSSNGHLDDVVFRRQSGQYCGLTPVLRPRISQRYLEYTEQDLYRDMELD